MKRDMDLIREQLLGVERLDAGTDEGVSLRTVFVRAPFSRN
ncbi:hypothetical protein [Bosea sp. TAF32]